MKKIILIFLFSFGFICFQNNNLKALNTPIHKGFSQSFQSININKTSFESFFTEQLFNKDLLFEEDEDEDTGNDKIKLLFNLYYQSNVIFNFFDDNFHTPSFLYLQKPSCKLFILNSVLRI